jgi:CHAT domain-containing protein
VSGDLANRLIEAESVGAFVFDQRCPLDWHTVALLKSEVDRLAGCDLNSATRLADKIRELSVHLGDSLSQAFADASRARVLDNAGRHAEANTLYEKAAAAMIRGGVKTDAAIIRKQQLHALIHLGRYEEALQKACAARRVLSKTDPVQLAQLEANIGNIYYRLDRYEKALSHYDKARQALSGYGDDTMLAVIDFSKSNVFADINRPDMALKLLDSAADRFDSAGRSLQAEQARFNIAYLKFLRGNYNGALASYFSVRDRVAELGSDELVAYCNLELAEILLALNAFEDASESADAAQKIFKELEMPFESARAAQALALADMGLGQFEQALGKLLEAREVFAGSHNAIFTALTDSYLAELAGKMGDYSEMLLRAGSSLRIFSRNRLSTRSAYSRLLAARAAYETGDLSKAARLARTALSAVEGAFAPGVAYQCYHLLGRIERERERLDEALTNFRLSVEAVEQMRGGIVVDEFKARFLHDKIEVYEDAITACLDKGGDDFTREAFLLVESSKSRALADLLARYARSDEGDRLPQDQRAKARAQFLKLIEDLNWFNSQARIEEEKGKNKNQATFDRYRQAAVRCERQISRSFQRMEAEDFHFTEARQMLPASESDLRCALREDEVAIEYFTTGDHISAFIASPGGIRVIRSIASKSRVSTLLSILRFHIEKFTYNSDYLKSHTAQLKQTTDEHLKRLYMEVFAPIESFLGTSRVIVIPHGVLHYVPFHALHDGGDYLVDRFEFSYVPSAAVLKVCRTRSASRAESNIESDVEMKDMVALGVADHDAPEIEEEITGLRAIFTDSVELIGNKATRENLLRFAPDARFLHLASHGYFQRDNPMFSSLKLADGRLNFYDLLDLKLKAEMVTLSACQTGVNAILPGDELHGLMRGFLYAGAPSLVVSLWKVSDHSTADIMKQMYLGIRAGDSKRTALRRAQLAVKSDYDHPYYWAPFILMGSPN